MDVVKLVTCPLCSWTLATQELSKPVATLANAHIQFHANQLVVDVESYLETVEEETDE